jgi:hypothetical protein
MYFYPQLHFVQLGGSWLVMSIQCHNLGLLKFLGDHKSDVMMESWQTPQQKEKRRNKEDPNLSQNNKTQSGSLSGKGTNHVPKAPPITRNISKRKG